MALPLLLWLWPLASALGTALLIAGPLLLILSWFFAGLTASTPKGGRR